MDNQERLEICMSVIVVLCINGILYGIIKLFDSIEDVDYTMLRNKH